MRSHAKTASFSTCACGREVERTVRGGPTPLRRGLCVLAKGRARGRWGGEEVARRDESSWRHS